MYHPSHKHDPIPTLCFCFFLVFSLFFRFRLKQIIQIINVKIKFRQNEMKRITKSLTQQPNGCYQGKKSSTKSRKTPLRFHLHILDCVYPSVRPLYLSIHLSVHIALFLTDSVSLISLSHHNSVWGLRGDCYI